MQGCILVTSVQLFHETTTKSQKSRLTTNTGRQTDDVGGIEVFMSFG